MKRGLAQCSDGAKAAWVRPCGGVVDISVAAANDEALAVVVVVEV